MLKPCPGLRTSEGRHSVALTLCLALSLGSAALAGPPADLVTGLNGTRGMALDEINDRLYFVEYNTGNLSYAALAPGCGPACAVTLVAAGFTHPLDVALDLDGGLAYVTTEDDPDTTGALWRVHLATGTANLVTFNLGAPHQIVLDLPTDSAYVVGRDLGRLWRVELSTGVKTAVSSGLSQPVGLALRADRTAAFVTEQGSGVLSEIDVQVGSLTGSVVTGLSTPSYLDWTDPSELSLLLSESAANQVLAIDLVTATAAPAVTGLTLQPMATVLDHLNGFAYLSLGSKIAGVELVDFDLGEPVFLGVGDVPSSQICDGYATTDPGYFRHFRHAPFGTTLNIFGNLNNFRALGATHYRVKISDGVAPPTALALSWNVYKWNPTTNRYQLEPVGPVAGDIYEIPAEYPLTAYRFKPPFLMMRWPSTSVADGLYTFSVEIGTYAGAIWSDLTHLLPVAVPCSTRVKPTGNGMTLMVDNTPPVVDLSNIRLHDPGTIIPACMIVQPFHGCNGYDFQITAADPNQHMGGYSLKALWGYNQSGVIASDSYPPPASEYEGPYLWSGKTNLWVPKSDPDGWQAVANCAHTFYLHGWKRTINGYHHVYWRSSHQSVTINNVCWSCSSTCSSPPCPTGSCTP